MKISAKKIEDILSGIDPINERHIYQAVVNHYPESFCMYENRHGIMPCSVTEEEQTTISVCGYTVTAYKHVPEYKGFGQYYSLKIVKDEK